MVRYCHPWSRGLSPSPPQKKKTTTHDFSKKASKIPFKCFVSIFEPSRNLQKRFFNSWLYQPHSQLPAKLPPGYFVWFLTPRCDKAGTHHRKESWAGMRLFLRADISRFIGPWDQKDQYSPIGSMHGIFTKPFPLECGHFSPDVNFTIHGSYGNVWVHQMIKLFSELNPRFIQIWQHVFPELRWGFIICKYNNSDISLLFRAWAHGHISPPSIKANLG